MIFFQGTSEQLEIFRRRMKPAEYVRHVAKHGKPRPVHVDRFGTIHTSGCSCACCNASRQELFNEMRSWARLF